MLPMALAPSLKSKTTPSVFSRKAFDPGLMNWRTKTDTVLKELSVSASGDMLNCTVSSSRLVPVTMSSVVAPCSPTALNRSISSDDPPRSIVTVWYKVDCVNELYATVAVLRVSHTQKVDRAYPPVLAVTVNEKTSFGYMGETGNVAYAPAEATRPSLVPYHAGDGCNAMDDDDSCWSISTPLKKSVTVARAILVVVNQATGRLSRRQYPKYQLPDLDKPPTSHDVTSMSVSSEPSSASVKVTVTSCMATRLFPLTSRS